MDEQPTTLTLTLSEDEARWLATAVTVLRRILQGAAVSELYATRGLAVLQRLGGKLPPGNYLEPDGRADSNPRNYGTRSSGDPA